LLRTFFRATVVRFTTVNARRSTPLPTAATNVASRIWAYEYSNLLVLNYCRHGEGGETARR
jgi:hypothetical protein